MERRPAASDGRQGSILLPVLLLLMVLATAATAMTLQARTSLREAATRRDRLVLAGLADGAVRATALALATAAASQSSPPLPLDGTPQACVIDGRRRLVLAAQDQGGLVDLNKAMPELVSLVLRRAGLPAPEAGDLADAILAHRAEASHGPAPAAAHGQARRIRGLAPAEARDFVLADQIGDLPGVDAALFARLRLLFTTTNRSAGVDPAVAGPAVRSLIPPKELASGAFQAMTTPSSHSDFAISATIRAPGGLSYGRVASYRIDSASGSLGQFTTWDAPPFDIGPEGMSGAFCARVAAALSPP